MSFKADPSHMSSSSSSSSSSSNPEDELDLTVAIYAQTQAFNAQQGALMNAYANNNLIMAYLNQEDNNQVSQGALRIESILFLSHVVFILSFFSIVIMYF